MYRGLISPLKILRLIHQLPRSSRLMRAAGGKQTDWTLDQYMLASVIDILQAANWQRSGGKGPKPKPLKRPTSVSNERQYGTKTTRTQAEIRAYLDSLHGD